MDYRITFTDRARVTARNAASEQEAREMCAHMGAIDTVTPLDQDTPTTGALTMEQARARTDAFYRRMADEYIARTR